MENIVLRGDCVEVMATLEAESVDAVVTDPPYNLGFMGRAWDRNHQHEPWAREAFRVSKPGAHLLAFGGTRTYHRLAAAIEDAGWEIRDCLVWAYASGFPKSLDVSKAIDKAAGHWRGRAGATTVVDQPAKGTEYERNGKGDPVTAAAAAGWGTALKPAWEPIVLARKPLRGTVAANFMEHGTGALNIDATRIPFVSSSDAAAAAAAAAAVGYAQSMEFGTVAEPTNLPTTYIKPPYEPDNIAGRWPANIILTDPIFDGDTPGVVGGGETASGFMAPTAVQTGQRTVFGQDSEAGYTTIETYGDSGSYSRFFLIPKADRTDREPVLRTDRELPFDDFNRNVGNVLARRRLNVHPTVKPVDLMRHLVRLVTPQNGLVLDPFLGSGTTAIACELEGFRWLGIEKEAEYVAIANARLNGTQRGMGLVG